MPGTARIPRTCDRRGRRLARRKESADRTHSFALRFHPTTHIFDRLHFAHLLSITFELLVHFLRTEEGTISRPHHGGLQTLNAPNGTLLSKERTALPEQTVKKHMQRYNAGLIRPNKANHSDQPLRRSTSILGRAPT